jgi:hypothetical protein
MRMIVAKNAVKKAAAALEEAKKIYYAEEDKNHDKSHFDPKAFSSRAIVKVRYNWIGIERTRTDYRRQTSVNVICQQAPHLSEASEI